jgi:hypothetical protein
VKVEIRLTAGGAGEHHASVNQLPMNGAYLSANFWLGEFPLWSAPTPKAVSNRSSEK